jgi:hypothetical protein
MTHRAVFFLLLFPLLGCVVLSAACNGGRRGVVRPRDGGIIVDSGRSDAGPSDSDIVLMDTGTTPECSASVPCPVGQTCVAGTCRSDTTRECVFDSDCAVGEICGAADRCIPDSTRTCEGSAITYIRDVYCSASTMGCIEACPDSPCIYDCLDADVNPDCRRCVSNNIVSCFNDAGCQGAWDAYMCCIEDNCGTEPTSTCIMGVRDGACAPTLTSYDTCGMGVDLGSVCPSFLPDCF